MNFKLFGILSIIWCVHAAPQNREIQLDKNNHFIKSQQKLRENDDLKAAPSSYSHQYSDWGGISPGRYEYSVTGYGVIDSRYGRNYADISSYDNPYQNARYPGGSGYSGDTGYGGNIGYVNTSGFDGSKGFGDYNPNSFGGNGGYGGYGGNGGLSSYSGYNNPYYQESNHLGYGYYNKRPGFGNIYNSGITPNLATGYRGYTRR